MRIARRLALRPFSTRAIYRLRGIPKGVSGVISILRRMWKPRKIAKSLEATFVGSSPRVTIKERDENSVTKKMSKPVSAEQILVSTGNESLAHCAPTRRSCTVAACVMRRCLAPLHGRGQAQERHRYSDRTGPAGAGRAVRICRDCAIPRRPVPSPRRFRQPQQLEAARPAGDRARRDLCFLIARGSITPVPTSPPSAYRAQPARFRAVRGGRRGSHRRYG